LRVSPDGAPLESFIAAEREASPALDGRSVFGWEVDIGVGKVVGSGDKTDL
jgi:hypothetical protein